MAGEQHSAGAGAAVAAQPASIFRSRSARLADQGEFYAVLHHHPPS